MRPLPSEEATPPVTNTCLVVAAHPWGARLSRRAASFGPIGARRAGGAVGQVQQFARVLRRRRRSPPSAEHPRQLAHPGVPGHERRTDEAVTEPSESLVTTRCRSANAATWARWVTTMTWVLRLRACSRRPTSMAAAPPTPASTSSNTMVGTGSAPASTTWTASMTRDSSPPEAAWAMGRSGAPGLAASIRAHVVDPGRAQGQGHIVAGHRQTGRVRGAGQRELHARARHRQGGQLGGDLLGEPLRGSRALLVQGDAAWSARRSRSAAICVARCSIRSSAPVRAAARPAACLRPGQHLADVRAVLAQQPTQVSLALLDGCQPPRIGLDVLGVAREVGSQLPQLGHDRADRGGGAGQVRVVRGRATPALGGPWPGGPSRHRHPRGRSPMRWLRGRCARQPGGCRRWPGARTRSRAWRPRRAAGRPRRSRPGRTPGRRVRGRVPSPPAAGPRPRVSRPRSSVTAPRTSSASASVSEPANESSRASARAPIRVWSCWPWITRSSPTTSPRTATGTPRPPSTLRPRGGHDPRGGQALVVQHPAGVLDDLAAAPDPGGRTSPRRRPDRLPMRTSPGSADHRRAGPGR